MPLDIVPSDCPHDCPRACALEVERIGGHPVGRVRGAAAQAYTQGVVCAKVARYAERQHHPERLSRPLRRVGEKGRGLDAFEPISWDAALDEVAETLARAALQMSRLPDIESFPEGGRLDCCRPFETEHFLDGFGHADRKFHFRADWRAIGPKHALLPPFPDHVAVIDEGDPERPFRLVAAPSRSFLNTSFNNTPSSVAREGWPTALVHPETLAGLGPGAGDRIRIGNSRGNLVVHARAFDGLQTRVVIVEGLWPNHAFEEGIGINLLTSADPGPPRGGAVFHDTSVWLSPA